MVQALIASGLKPIYSEHRERLLRSMNHAEYSLNPHGFYEPSELDYLKVGWLASLPDDCAIKLPIHALSVLPSRKTVVYWMHRKPEELKASFHASWPKETFESRFPRWPLELIERESVTRDILDDRKSIEVVDVQYSEVIANPSILDSIRPGMAKAVDRALYRNAA